MSKKLIWIDPINRDAHFLKLISEVMLNSGMKSFEVFTTQRSNMEMSSEIVSKPFFQSVHTLDAGKIPLSRKTQLLLQYLPGFQAVAKGIDSESIILYSSGMSLPELEWLGLQQVKRRASKVFSLIHNLEDSQSKIVKLSNWRNRRLLQVFDGWVFLSEHTRKKAIAQLNLPLAKTHVMLHPHFEPMLKETQSCHRVGSSLREFTKNRLVIAYISRVDQEHGIDIFYQLLQRGIYQGLPICGVVIGRLGKDWNYGRNKEKIHSCGLSEETLFTQLGSYTYAELRSVLSIADFVFAPYRRISQSGAIALALGEQVPVIASNVGANSEMIKHERNGLLFDLHNLEYVLKEMVMTYENNQTMRQRFTEMALFNSHLEPTENVSKMLTWLKTQT